MGAQRAEVQGEKAVHISTATTTGIVASGKVCTLIRIVVNNVIASTITVNDTAATPVAWAIIGVSAPIGSIEYGVKLAGLSIVTAGASDLTVVYRLGA
jgi:hypothetical protein